MNAQRGLLLYFLVALIAVTIAKTYISEKRMKEPSSFKTMMRYGRSRNSHNKENKVNVQPRTDAFFLGPRYGKRSSWNPAATLVYPVAGASLCVLDHDLSCSYTGVSDLYRCSLRKEQSDDLSTSSI